MIYKLLLFFLGIFLPFFAYSDIRVLYFNISAGRLVFATIFQFMNYYLLRDYDNSEYFISEIYRITGCGSNIFVIGFVDEMLTPLVATLYENH